MARQCKIEREKKLAKAIKKNLAIRIELRKKNRDVNLSLDERVEAQFALQKLRNSSTTRARNRCFLTGRSRGVYSRFGLSRHKIREYAMSGMIPGIRKASW